MIIATLLEFAGHAWETLGATSPQPIADGVDPNWTTLLDNHAVRAFAVLPVDII
ncbi:hypothetical protein [Nocardia brevicatena]|uniref:hypothetical protein n=1 Tax=Nocardia brevicatena TaxID=37327 RepID=UPI0002F014C7|nr:hypothetical protein [Nocardia brevicatena]